MDQKWLKVLPKRQLTFDAEGNDKESSIYFTRKIHWPGGASGITIARGYDLGQQAKANDELTQANISEPLKSWLLECQGITGEKAKEKYTSAPDNIRNFIISRKQQYDLFNMAYDRLEKDVKRICQKKDTLLAYHSNPNIDPEQAWDEIPQKIKVILIDLRYRGDYTPASRKLMQRYAYSGDIDNFGIILKNKSNWPPNLPMDRFTRRIDYYESN
ncbi:pesticin C-terminus-like muramidase [Xenorhabdus santafensis]|uniref:pesticin C-terminus-like muramidase n=1 Tax=Xenorhabdus santafensis TaxID=2582833 RepID=UPI0029E80F7F|nr:pesticin C-terminus-like muramidase [Xenorhabdus sp. 12]